MAVAKIIVFIALFDVMLGSKLLFPRAKRDITSEETSEEICELNEVYTNCVGDCEPSCIQPNPTCPNPYTGICVPGCICPTGTLRDYNQQCVTQLLCQFCPPGEQYTECGAFCEPTCTDPKPFDCPQCQPGCVCSVGTVRDVTTGECVTIESC